MAKIKVTRTYEDGYTDTYESQNGDTEKNRKARFRRAGVAIKQGPGWVETRGHIPGLGDHTERIEWPCQD